MANGGSHPELPAEQAYIEKVEATVQSSRSKGERIAESAGDRFSARNLREQTLKRLAEPVDAEALCFGRIDYANGRKYYLGRGLVLDDDSQSLVINWRRPLAAPFYEAQRMDPKGLQLRRRFQLDQLRLLGILDDVFVDANGGAEVAPSAPEVDLPELPEVVTGAIRTKELEAPVEPEPVAQPSPESDERFEAESEQEEEVRAPAVSAIDTPAVSPARLPEPPEIDPSLGDAILADMNRARGAGMRDIVATIEANQYRLISDSIEGILTIQGGPGTGKTAIALHRAAWLLYNHREELDRSRVLVVGPNRAFMEYVAEVLPSLGEAAVVQLAVDRLADLDDVRVRGSEPLETARLKGDSRMADVIAAAVRARVRLPRADVELDVGRTRITLPSAQIAGLVENARRDGADYVGARAVFRRLLTALAVEAAPPGRSRFRSSVSGDEIEAALTARSGPFDQIWPTATAPEVVRDLFNSTQRLAAAADGILSSTESGLLQRDRQPSLRDEPWTAADIALLDAADVDLRGIRRSFGYVLADEAQDLSPMQLKMVLRRSRGARATLVGDMAQATAPVRFKDWDGLLQASGVLEQSRIAELAVGYRVPSQIADLAAQLLPRIAPDLLVPKAVRLGPEEPRVIRLNEGEIGDELVRQVRERVDGERRIGVMVGSGGIDVVRGALLEAGLIIGDVLTDGLSRQITLLTPAQAKGLEFDHVIVVEPAAMAGPDEEWAYVYIAMTRATRTLTVLHSTPEPFELPVVPVIEPEELSLRHEAEDPDTQDATVLGPRYTEALMQAKFLHSGQHRRGTLVPYLAHLQAVSALVLEDGGTEDEAIAALLHDSVEDSEPEFLERIVEQFGVGVARIVAGCTDPEVADGVSWRERKVEHIKQLESAGPQVRRVALAEKLDNARALLRDYRRVGPRVWSRMEVDEEDLLWYQQALADLFATERPGDLASELQTTVETLLELVSAPAADLLTVSVGATDH